VEESIGMSLNPQQGPALNHNRHQRLGARAGPAHTKSCRSPANACIKGFKGWSQVSLTCSMTLAMYCSRTRVSHQLIRRPRGERQNRLGRSTFPAHLLELVQVG
jgi:hypothetical protein